MALNNRMKEVQKAALSDEKHTIQLLQRIYEQAAKDTEAKIAALNARTDLQNIQSIVYQKQYQEALKKQLDGIINDLHTQSFTTVSEYLGKSYEHGFYGTLYDLHGQGVPFLFPIRQDEVVKALNNDYSNIAKTQRGKDIYKRMGENTDYLKKAVRAEVSRGIANGSSWLDMASHVAKGMNSPFNRAMKRAFLITRTEGHRIQNQATVDVQKRAKGLGADIVKQWDATLDANTRPWHADADGQIREIDEEFDVGGEKMKAPGIGGSARNVCNCRCVLLQRARWALNKNETKYLGDVPRMTDKQKEDIAKKLGVDVADLPNISKSIVPIRSKDYDDFKEQAKKSTDEMELDDCSSYDDFRKYISKNYLGVQVTDSLEKCNFEAVKESFKGANEVFSEFPQAKKILTQINGDEHGRNVVASASYFGAIQYNPNYFQKAIDESNNRYTGSFHPKNGNTSKGTIAHECGHLLERALIEKNTTSSMAAINEWDKCTEATRIVHDAASVLKKTEYGKGKRIYHLVADVSEYAMANRSECLAECVCDYVMNGEDAAPLAKEVWKILKKELG